MSTEDIKITPAANEPTEHKAPANNLGQKIIIMRLVTVMLTVIALAVAILLLVVGGTAIIASNLGLESLSSFRIPLDSLLGLTVFFVVTVSARTYTIMRHKELLVEQQISSSK